MYPFKIKENSKGLQYISSWSKILKTSWYVYDVKDMRT